MYSGSRRSSHGDDHQSRESVPQQGGIRYINEDMIKKVSKSDHIESITTLNLTLSREGGKKIKYIENLERCKKVQSLNLSCNVIEKIEKLDKLTRLRELNLSYNKIIKIEGIETLTSLQVLNFTGNLIEHVPVWIGKKLKSLKVFKIARNQIESLQDLTRLKQLKDLTTLSASENPVARLPHYRLYVIFHMRTVEILDAQPIDWTERNTAHARFSQDELEAVELRLEQQTQQYQRLQEEHNKSVHEIQTKEQKRKDQIDRLKTMNEKVSDLERELDTKNNLLKRKTSELTKACEKHYELEQELAFYKIDHKFESLGRLPTPDSGSANEDGGLIGESPYVGKGRFQQKKHAREKVAVPPLNLPHGLGSSNESGNGSLNGSNMDDETREKFHQALDRELEDKHHAIESAQERLYKLQDELILTENRMSRATDELHKIANATPGVSLTEDDKQSIRNKLARRISKVHQLKGEADKIETEMNHAQGDIIDQEKDIGRLRAKLRRMGSKDSLYDVVKKEMADKEMQLDLTNQQYQELKDQLEGMLATIAKETEDIKRLEQQLRDGQVQQNAEIKSELEGIIAGLQSYLQDVQSKADRQKTDYDHLVRDREEVMQRLHDVETERLELEMKVAELPHLHQHLTELEESLQNQRDMNESLQHHLDETNLREVDDADLSHQLHDAEEEMNKLQEALDETNRKLQTNQESFTKKLASEKKRNDHLSKQAQSAEDLDDNIAKYHEKLRALQAANADLQQQLYNQKQKLKDQKKDNVDPEDLRRRLEEVLRNVRSGKMKTDVRGKDDKVGAALGDLQEKMQKELDKSFKERERAKEAAARAESEVAALQNQLSHLRGKKIPDTSFQAKLEQQQDEMDGLHDQIRHLQAELERERVKPIPNRLLEPTPRGETSSGSSTEDSSTIPSSQWSKKKREIYEDMTMEEQDLFDELQEEIDDLRKLLGMRDKSGPFGEKVAAASQTAAKLRDLIAKRRSSELDSNSDRPSTKRSKGTGDPRLRTVAYDLKKANEEMDDLQAQLRVRDKIIRDEIAQSDKSQNTIVAQQDEMDQLHGILEEQRAEIVKLDNTLKVITGRPIDQYAAYEAEVQQVSQGLAGVRNRLAREGPRIQGLGGRGEPNGYQNQYQEEAFYEHPQVVAPPGHTPGRPVPVFYGQDRQPIQPEDHMDGMARQRPPPPPQYPGGNQNQNHGLPVYSGGREPHVQMGAVFDDGGFIPAQHMGPGPMHYPGPPPPPHHGGGPRNGDVFVQPEPYIAQNGPRMEGPIHGFIPPSQPMSGLPISPVRQMTQQLTPGGPVVFSAPTTPLAGAGIGHVMTTTPVDARGQPVMVSTPVNPASGGPGRGILKKAKSEDELICSVPEHHDMEDYVAKLQKKIKSLKSKLKKHDTSIDEDESRQVAFEDDAERHAIRRLKAELEDRRAELEGLDLAIERQKNSLNNMKKGERELLVERKVAKEQLKRIRTGKERRRAFVNGEAEAFDTVDSDYDYDYNPKSRVSRKDYLLDEIDCLEGTLAKRRAELREADRLLQECELDLSDAKHEAKETLEQYDEAKHGFKSTVLEADEIERRAYDAGVKLVKAEEQFEIMKIELEELLEEKIGQEDMLKQIALIISNKDEEFKVLDAKVRQSTQHLQLLHGDLDQAETRQQQRVDLMTESEHVVEDRKRELDMFKVQISEQKQELEVLDRQMGKEKAELELIEETIAKRQRQLEMIEKDVESEIEQKRKDILSTEDRVEDLRAEQRRIETDVAEKKNQLAEVQHHLDHEEAVLQNLATTTNKQRSELRDIQTNKNECKTEFESLRIQLAQKHLELDKVQNLIIEERRTADSVKADIARKGAEIERLRLSREKYQEEIDSLSHQQRSLEKTNLNLRKEKAALEDSHRTIEKKISDLKRVQGIAEENYRSSKNKAQKKEGELRQLENDIDDATQEKGQVKGQISSLNDEMKNTKSKLKDAKADLEEVREEIDKRKKEVDEMAAQSTDKEKEVKILQENIKQIQQVLQDLEEEIKKKEEKNRNLKEQTDEAYSQHQTAHQALHQTRTQLEEEQQTLRQTLSTAKYELEHLKSEHTIKQDELEHNKAKVEHLQHESERLERNEARFVEMEKKVSELSREVDARSQEKEQLAYALERSCDELQNLKTKVNKESERQLTEISTQKKEVEALQNECLSRNKEKEELTAEIQVIQKDTNDLQQQVLDKGQELQHIREKSNKEIADLEAIAQAHYSRANRLSDELNYLQAEHLELRRKMQSQEEMAEKEMKLQDTLMELKSEIKTNLDETKQDLEKSKGEAKSELDTMYGQKERLEIQLGALKTNLEVIRNNTANERQTSLDYDTQKETQDFLKQQLQQKMARHAEAMQSQRQLSQENLQKLQQKLANLEQALSSSQPDSVRATSVLTPVSDILSVRSGVISSKENTDGEDREVEFAMQPLETKDLDLDLVHGFSLSQCTDDRSQRSLSTNASKIAYSQTRHSANRSRSSSDIPEKGPSS